MPLLSHSTRQLLLLSHATHYILSASFTPSSHSNPQRGDFFLVDQLSDFLEGGAREVKLRGNILGYVGDGREGGKL